MAWELYIHQLDVFQGESTLIVARDPALGLIRTMLVDGGRSYESETVHDYVVNHIFAQPSVDVIVTTHYDEDHYGGLENLLVADNCYTLIQTIAAAAGAAAFATANALANNALLNQTASAAAAAHAAAFGAYDDNNGFNRNTTAVAAGAAGRIALGAMTVTAAGAAADGYAAGEDVAERVFRLNEKLIKGPRKRREACEAAGIAAGAAAGATAAARAAAAVAAIRPVLETACPVWSRFDTGGLYSATTIIDGGDHTDPPEPEYTNAVDGRFTMSANYVVRAPNSDRIRLTPGLGDEILWNTGPAPMAAPAGAPAVFVVARNRYVRNAPRGSVPIGGNASNNTSFGLIVRFNNFFFYTGGDLPVGGEDLVLQDILANGLPNPAGGVGATFAAPNHICAFKCGHHGSATSTSQWFVDNISAASALISTGGNMFEHPDQPVIDRLHNDGDIRRFYFTNIHWDSAHVPASNGQNQFAAAGNKAFVAGDNNIINFAAGRHRGDIEIRVNQAESLSVTHPPAALAGGAVHHQFRLRYWEDDWPGGGAFIIGPFAH